MLIFAPTFFAVNLVERNPAPNGYQLLNPNYVGKHNAFDLVSLAHEIQNADLALNNQSGKLSLILDQVSVNKCTGNVNGLRNTAQHTNKSQHSIIKLLAKAKFSSIFHDYRISLSLDSFPPITSAPDIARHQNRHESTPSGLQFQESSWQNLLFISTRIGTVLL